MTDHTFSSFDSMYPLRSVSYLLQACGKKKKKGEVTQAANLTKYVTASIGTCWSFLFKFTARVLCVCVCVFALSEARSTLVCGKTTCGKAPGSSSRSSAFTTKDPSKTIR